MSLSCKYIINFYFSYKNGSNISKVLLSITRNNGLSMNNVCESTERFSEILIYCRPNQTWVNYLKICKSKLKLPLSSINLCFYSPLLSDSGMKTL
jgi:hypothetical protein